MVEPVERARLGWLICSISVLTVLLVQFVPPISFLMVVCATALLMIGSRIFARYHQRHEVFAADSVADPGATTVAGSGIPGLGGANQSKDLSKGLPSVLVLVSAHNEAPVIAKTVDALLKIDYPNYQLLVIDDRSTDATAEILHGLKSRLSLGRFQFHCRPTSSRPGKSAAINDILKDRTEDLICVLDADAYVEPDFLTNIVAYFADARVGAVQARKALLNAKQNLLTQCQENEFCMDSYLQFVRDTIYGVVELRGNGMIIRRNALMALGGLNEQSLSEDLDLSTRMHVAAWNIRFAENCKVWEEGPYLLEPLLKQRIRWTEGCIIRYLEYAPQILFGKQVAFRTKMDMLQFVFEFVAPVWILLEFGLLGIKWMTGQLSEPRVPYAASALLVLTFYFLYATYRGLRRFAAASIAGSIYGTILVYLYFAILWPPIVACLFARILGRKERNLVWEKTPHYGVVSE